MPVKVAPNLKEGRILDAKKFLKKRKSGFVYVFQDPKKENEFYNYINTKFQTNYDDEQGNIKITINKMPYYLTFYEVNKETKTINLIPILINSKLEEKGKAPLLKDAERSSIQTWYIVLTVTDVFLEDSLAPSYSHRAKVLHYLEQMQHEYLTTSNYIEAYLRN